VIVFSRLYGSKIKKLQSGLQIGVLMKKIEAIFLVTIRDTNRYGLCPSYHLKMSTASGTTGAVVGTPPSSPKVGPKVCPGAPERVPRPAYQPHSGIVGRRLDLGNEGNGAAALASMQGQMAAMGLGSQ